MSEAYTYDVYFEWFNLKTQQIEVGAQDVTAMLDHSAIAARLMRDGITAVLYGDMMWIPPHRICQIVQRKRIER